MHDRLVTRGRRSGCCCGATEGGPRGGNGVMLLLLPKSVSVLWITNYNIYQQSLSSQPVISLAHIFHHPCGDCRHTHCLFSCHRQPSIAAGREPTQSSHGLSWLIGTCCAYAAERSITWSQLILSAAS